MNARNHLSHNRSAEDWNRLGVRRALRGEWRTARDCFERALAGRGDVLEFWINLGIASIQLHDEDTGRGAFEVAETLAPRPRGDRIVPCLAPKPLHRSIERSIQ